jgi:hypothetical protein
MLLNTAIRVESVEMFIVLVIHIFVDGMPATRLQNIPSIATVFYSRNI